ncbi:MAG: flavin reductase family protein [Desulfobacterales bacterium]|nr:flavin reductase family protein [Desulfobacterales bacterium]
MKFDPAVSDVKRTYEIMSYSVIPRPIAWVSTVSSDGINNLAPYSYFTPICNMPMIVGFSLGRKGKGKKKDTLVNIETTKEFVINMVTEALAEAMNKTATAYPPHVDEFEKANLTPAKSELVAPPRVDEAPICMECRLKQILEFGEDAKFHNFVVGEVVMVHIKEEFVSEERILAAKLDIIGRLGSRENLYCRTTDMFTVRLS